MPGYIGDAMGCDLVHIVSDEGAEFLRGFTGEFTGEIVDGENGDTGLTEVLLDFAFSVVKVTVASLGPLLEKIGGIGNLEDESQAAALISEGLRQYVGNRAGTEPPTGTEYIQLIRGKSEILYRKFMQRGIRPIVDWTIKTYKRAVELLKRAA